MNVGDTPEQFAQVIQSDIKKWGAVVKATGVPVGLSGHVGAVSRARRGRMRQNLSPRRSHFRLSSNRVTA